MLTILRGIVDPGHCNVENNSCLSKSCGTAICHGDCSHCTRYAECGSPVL